MLLFLGRWRGFVAGLAGFGTALMALGIWLYVLPLRSRYRWSSSVRVVGKLQRCRRFGGPSTSGWCGHS